MSPAVDATLAALTRRLLGDDHGAPTVSPSSWDTLVAAARANNVLGALAWAAADGWLDVPDEPFGALLDAAATSSTNVLAIEQDALRCVRLLRAAGVEPVVVKGVAVAHLDWPDAALRGFGDVDLLVPPAALDRAVAALGADGFRRDLPERRPGFDRRFAKDLAVVASSSAEVDLHRTLVDGALGQAITADDLHAGSDPVALGGEALRALPLPHRLLHSAYSVTVSDDRPRVASVVDLGLQLQRPELDVDEVRRLARRWRAEAVLAEAVQVVAEQLGGSRSFGGLVAWASTYEPTGWERLVRSTYRSGRGSNTSTLLGGVLGIRGWSARAAYLHGLVLPGRPYREARRARGRSTEWSTGVRELLRTRR